MVKTKKQSYVGLLILQDAEPMSLGEAKTAGLVKEDNESEEEGYKCTNSKGFVSWLPKTVFERIYTVLTATDEKVFEKLENPINEIKQVLKIRGHVDKIESKQWSLKKLGSEVLKVYGVDLNNINNDKF